MMNRTWRTISLGTFVVLAVLGTAGALGRASSSSHTQGKAAVSGSAKASDAVPALLSREPMDVQPAAIDSSPEYDRSDLTLSQG